MQINHSERTHALLSASSAARWLACPPSAVAAAAHPEQDTEFTREGTTAHEVAEIVTRRRVPQLYPDIDTFEYPEGYTTEMIECAESYSDYILELVTVESPLILLEQRVDYSPWAPDGSGTADCIIIQGKVMDVVDYKFGKGVAVSAEHNPQEQLYGLGALNDYGFIYDIEQVRLHIFQPRINNVSSYTLTANELLDWGGSIRPTAELAAKGKGKYNAGAHCKFCPHAGRCRTLTKVCTDRVEAYGLSAKVPVLAPHEIADILQAEPLITLWLKRVKEQALSSLMSGESVPGYKLVEGKPGNRKWTDELKVLEALEQAGYSREDVTVTSLLSPAGVEKAIGKKKAAQLLDGFTTRSPGAPTVVPETDKRPVYDPTGDFEKLED